MKYFIPTYEQCREICDANDNFTFFETKHEVEGFNISIFSYRLAMPTLFTNPVKTKPEITAHELRGLTFVWNKDGSLFAKYLLMDKFFNLNQSECSSYSLLKDEGIKEITNKEDGSIASFIKLPNGKIIGRSKASFISDQAIQVGKIYNENKAIKNLVDYCFNNGIIPIFEYVSPRNRIVLIYNKTDLVLLKLRLNKTGEYISIKDLPSDIKNGVTIVKSFDNLSLDDLIAKCETETGYEGFVVTFDSDKMIKLKLKEYCDLHNLHTEDLHREDAIISFIIEEKIDDILCQLEDGDERKTTVIQTIEIVNHHIAHEVREINNLLKKYKGNNKEFAAKFIKNKYFHACMLQVNRHGKINKMVLELCDKIDYLKKVIEYTPEWYENHFEDVKRRISLVKIGNDDPRKVLIDELLLVVDKNGDKSITEEIREAIKLFGKLFIGENDIVNIVKDKVLLDTFYLFEARKWIDNNKKLLNV